MSPALVEQLQSEISDEDYEAKVAGLLERSWKREHLESGQAAGEAYREAFTVLRRGDHYLLIMIRRALGPHLRPWWAFWR